MKLKDIELDDDLYESLLDCTEDRGVTVEVLMCDLLRDGIRQMRNLCIEEALIENYALHYLIGNRLKNSIETGGDDSEWCSENDRGELALGIMRLLEKNKIQLKAALNSAMAGRAIKGRRRQDHDS